MKKSISTCVAIIFTFLASTVSAQPGPISIPPMPGDKSIEIVQTVSVYGSCGGAVVQVSGIDRQTFDTKAPSFQFDASNGAGVYVIPDGGKPATKLDSSDHNTLVCLPVGKEFRLIMGTACGGSACGDGMNYQILDPKSGKVVSPRMCDIDCVTKVIKMDVLKKNGYM